jgi:signal transduction histidine kinase
MPIPVPFWTDRLAPFGARTARWSGTAVQVGCFCLTLCILVPDYYLGRHFSTAMLYMVPILALAWLVDGKSALLLAIASTVLWEVAVNNDGRDTPSQVLLINGVMRLVLDISFIAILVRLKHLQENLRSLAETRALALAQEAARCIRLEREMLEVSEREQRRIGQDLHDSLCQHLAGTALAGQVLAGALQEEKDRRDARRLVELIEEGIAITREIAKGLYPIETRADGLMQALEELADRIPNMFGVECRFVCDLPVLIENPTTAANLYRIAQEAVSNALRHGRATRIEIFLEEADNGIRLRVSDNGRGLPHPLPQNDGMGLRTMAERARFISGQFSVGRGPRGGTDAVCVAPARWLT